MIFNYIKLALRNLRKRPSFSFINILGLALGISACLLILNYIDFETSYDNFHSNSKEVFRVNRTWIQNGERSQPNVVTTYGLGPALVNDIPHIKKYVRTVDDFGIISYQPGNSKETISFREKNGLAVDSTFFDVFTFKQIMGHLPTALDNPRSIVLTETLWHKYFGYDDPIGKTIKYANGYPNEQYVVTAVIEDVPANSHFSFQHLVPIHNTLAEGQYKKDDGWQWNNFSTYVQLDNANNLVLAAEQLPAFANRRINPRLERYNGSVELRLQPLLSIHTEPGLRNDVETISLNTIHFFELIALFILFIAWINYVNLSTARALERSKEVGVKKAIGALRIELVVQFLFESMVINIIAIALAIGFAILLLPALSDMIGKELPNHLTDIRLWIVLVTLFVAGAIASGIYPAFVLSSFKISKAIKNHSERGFSLRKGLVVFQFASSLMLIAGTFAVYRQINHMQSLDKGLQMDQMVVIDASGPLSWEETQKKVKIFKDEIRKIAGVASVTSSGAIPGGGHNWGADIRKLGEPESSNTGISIVYVDPDFIPTYEIELVAGRNFNPESASDMEGVIINEAAVKSLRLGTLEEALTQKLLIDDTVEIIGISKNFNWNSLKADFNPFALKAIPIFPYHVSIHIEGGSIPTTIAAIEQVYKTVLPDTPFDYKFLDDSFNTQYKSDSQFGKIFGLFAGLAIAICCLGLWGLASFTTSQRLKEIGIRKVLGASVGNISLLLVRQFAILIAVSAVIAIPLAWYGMDSWLSGFAFKIGITWELLAVPVVILTLIALLTIGLQVRRGAVMNPVDVLKAE